MGAQGSRAFGLPGSGAWGLKAWSAMATVNPPKQAPGQEIRGLPSVWGEFAPNRNLLWVKPLSFLILTEQIGCSQDKVAIHRLGLLSRGRIAWLLTSRGISLYVWTTLRSSDTRLNRNIAKGSDQQLRTESEEAKGYLRKHASQDSLSAWFVKARRSISTGFRNPRSISDRPHQASRLPDWIKRWLFSRDPNLQIGRATP